MTPKVAIVSDWLVSRGGAERVVHALAEMYPSAPIYTSLYNPKILPEFQYREVITSFLQKMPLSLKKHPYYLPLMPYAFESFDLSQFDIVISSSHSCAKGIITKPQTLHISYCHTPMRYAWDDCHLYMEQYGIMPILKVKARTLIHDLRMWDRLSADRVDFFVANSEHVKKRIEKYYRRESEVIYPPVDTKKFAAGDRKQKGGYFLAVGRLTPYKRFDLLIDTFNELKLPLLIIGKGKEEAALKKRAGRFITFLGAITDAELKDLYTGAIALIFPQKEDFGMIPVEAMSSGTPVIAYEDGGALETVIEGKTGLFFKEQRYESLKKAVLQSSEIQWDPLYIEKHAKRFDKEVFQAKMRDFVGEKWELWQKDMRR